MGSSRCNGTNPYAGMAMTMGMKVEYITHVLGQLSLRNWNGGLVNRPRRFRTLTIYGNAAPNPRTGKVEQFIITFSQNIWAKVDVVLYRSVEHGYSSKEHSVSLTDVDKKRLMDMLPFVQRSIEERIALSDEKSELAKRLIQEWP